MRYKPIIVNYRDAIYQGQFNYNTQQKNGFGILYSTNNHKFIVSNWNHDQLNQHTLIYFGQSCYMYGTWYEGLPHGIIVHRLGDTLLIAQYVMGDICNKFIIVTQKYNIVIAYKLNTQQPGQSQILKKGQLYNKLKLSQFFQQLDWQFPTAYETIVKYISQFLLNNYCKIKLLQNKYRYGYEDGLAIIFNDQYLISSTGSFRRQNLQIGIKYINSQIEEGNWENNKVFAYVDDKPKKVFKVYKNYHLKSLNFLNKCQQKYGEIYMDQTIFIINHQIGKKVLAGMLTSRIDGDSLQSAHLRKSIRQQTQRLSLIQDSPLPSERLQLQLIRNQIYESILKKKIHAQLYQLEQIQPTKQKQRDSYINILPVGKIVRGQPQSRKKNRVGIFDRSRSISPDASVRSISPFTQKIKSRIFDRQKKHIQIRESSISPVKQQFTQKQEQLYKFIKNQQQIKKKPIFMNQKHNQQRKYHPEQQQKSLRKSNLKKQNQKQYDSPYNNFDFTNSKNISESKIQPYPISYKQQYQSPTKKVKIIEQPRFFHQPYLQKNKQTQQKYKDKQISKKVINSFENIHFKNKSYTMSPIIQQISKKKIEETIDIRQISPQPQRKKATKKDQKFPHNNSVYLQQQNKKKSFNEPYLNLQYVNKKKEHLGKQYNNLFNRQIQIQRKLTQKIIANNNIQSSEKKTASYAKKFQMKKEKTPQKNNNYIGQRIIQQSPLQRGDYNYYFQ